VYTPGKKKLKNKQLTLMGSSSPMDSNSVFGASGGRSVDTGSSQFQTDFSQGGIGAIDTEEVDPIAEADVYMAYGRDAQAEEILKEALQKDPKRLAVHSKLLEIYATRKDQRAFETTARQLQDASGGSGAEWEKAVALGLSVDPENSLYGGRKAEGSVAAPVFSASSVAATPDIPLDAGFAEETPVSLDLDLDLGAGSAQGGSQPDIPLGAPTLPAADAPLDLGFDLNLGDETKPAGEVSDFSPGGTLIVDAGSMPAPAADAGFDINFELPGSSAPAPAPSAVSAAPSAAGSSIDFDFNLGDAPSAAAPKAPDVDLSSISLDLGTPGNGSSAPGGDPHWQEVATKLDLAKAYEEMGDKDGARELLKEVMKEGDGAQQQKAQTMLQGLG
jgi:pilus assembly protein FimV